MRITRLYLRNYRVYEDELDLELPPGLVGVVGANGAGKSVLLESILWTLFGYARTAKDEVRTTGVGGECVSEVEFEHEGHLYRVSRTLSGINATVKAHAVADGAQVAEGGQSVRQYVHSVLGMDVAAFRASVFAEQKQLAAFSAQRPAERRDLVLRLLGVTPLDKAREQARHDARAAQKVHDDLRRVLPDLDALAVAADDAEAASGARTAEAEAEEAAAAAARQRLHTAEQRFERLDQLRQEHEALVAEGRTVKAEHEGAAGEADRLRSELCELDELTTAVPALEVQAAGLEDGERRLRLVEDVVAAARALARLPVVAEPDPPDEVGCEAARHAAEHDAARLAEVSGLLRAAQEAEVRAAEALARSGELSTQGLCPVCGQELGRAFERVQEHRAAEAAEAAERVRGLEEERGRLAASARASRRRADESSSALRAARTARTEHEQHRARRQAAEQAVAEAKALLGGEAGADEAAELAALVGARRRAAAELQRVRGRLERRPVVEAALETAWSRAAAAAGRVDALRDKVRSLGFRADELAAARQARDDAAVAAERATGAARQAGLVAERARAQAEAAASSLVQARTQHATLDTRAHEARHLGRLAELLSAFRNTVVATVGPRLSAGAADLFAELTDHEYDRLEVDPDSYEILIRDQGRLYGMDRFSGSETDLANLALRVAISEHVRLLSGGVVGLLVLDEVFGPLDEDRKARMLAALERLRGRFRQVLVVTHDDAVKAELPNAVEVVKLPGRRATARLVNA